MLRVFCDGERHQDVSVVEVAESAVVSDLIVAVQTLLKMPVESAWAFLDGEGQPLPHQQQIKEHVARGKVIHVHRAREIKVTVHYGGKSHHHKFPPPTLVDEVRKWAIKAFHVDPTFAPEMELALDGHTETLPRTAPIGRFVDHPRHELELDLVRGVLPNG